MKLYRPICSQGQVLNPSQHQLAHFSIRGISPALEPDNPLAFPIRLAFDAPTATANFQMIPFIEDVPNNNGGDNQTVPEPRFILGLLATSFFVWRNKQKNLLGVAA